MHSKNPALLEREQHVTESNVSNYIAAALEPSLWDKDFHNGLEH